MITITNILDVEKYVDDVDAVVFDLDDTLYPEKEYVRSGYRIIAEWLGNMDVANKLWDVFQRGGKAIDEVIDEQYRPEALRRYRFQKPDIHLYAGVREMIANLRQTKYIGIITDGRPEGQRAKLEALSIEVDAVIITDELGGPEFRKPCPVAFEKMRGIFNTPYERMVYIGDNTRKDFIAPEALKMKCIHLQNKEGLYYGK